jgi:hypothetical protein
MKVFKWRVLVADTRTMAESVMYVVTPAYSSHKAREQAIVNFLLERPFSKLEDLECVVSPCDENWNEIQGKEI